MPTVSKVVFIPFDLLTATSNTLFIGDMPENVDEEKMKTFLDMTFMSNNGIRLCGPAEKKIGFVEFDTAEEANEAMLKGPLVFKSDGGMEKILRVKKSKRECQILHCQ